MALHMLVGGAECGPSNPLQALSKRFDQDKGIQQDFFGGGGTGATNQLFLTQQGNISRDQDATQFFSNTSQSSFVSKNTVDTALYDMKAMQAALPPQALFVQQQAPLASWAADFMQQRQPLHSEQQQPLLQDLNTNLTNDLGLHSPSTHVPNAGVQWTANFRTPAFVPHISHIQQRPSVTTGISWDKEFQAQDLQLASDVSTISQGEEKAHQSHGEADDLSRTAGYLLDAVKHEQNPKFQNSQFLGLMQQLRDREVVVTGNKIVETQEKTSHTVDVKGKGRAVERVPITAINTAKIATTTPRVMAVTQQEQGQQVSTSEQETEGDANDAYFRQENEDFIRFWNQDRDSNANSFQASTAETMFWEKLQDDWDNFEATATGIKAVDGYRFLPNNTYLPGDSSTTRHHLMHSGSTSISSSESLLQLEAAVQCNLNDASAWFELGVKQQENEREHKAVQALQRAVGLDPSHLPAWLALAISYTNENDHEGTHNAIYEWISRNAKYESDVQKFRELRPDTPRMTLTERYANLIQCLISMVASTSGGEIDADLQVALAVLLSTNEEYSKALDCFGTALAVRPDDWLLYNRVGATMANSGRAEQALEYYYRALELNPGYIRARFNLGISYINLHRYEEAAQHILDALVLQESDGIEEKVESDEKRGVISTVLWDTLRTTSLHLRRPDLADLCDSKDLEGFRNQFIYR